MIIKFDRIGLDKALFQARLFEASVDKYGTSSPVFLRRFYRSSYAAKLDTCPGDLFLYDLNDAFYRLDEQYGKSSYGTLRYPKENLYWLGYLSRYICYTRNFDSRLFYSFFDVKQICQSYPAYHTQSEEWCLAHLLAQYGYTEDDLDRNKRLKKIIKASRIEHKLILDK